MEVETLPDTKLLIAEDEDNVRNSMYNFIRAKSDVVSEIYLAANGQEAIDAIFRHRPHIMLLDIQMPLKDGLTVMEEATAAGVCPKTIIMSGYDEFEYARKALRYNAVDYLLKPCRSSDILDRIRMLASGGFGETEQQNGKTNSSGNATVDAAVSFMEEHYHKELTLPFVAEQIGISPGYLSTLFTRTMGCGFADCLNHIRIDRACDYFYDNRIKTYEVAFKVGFKDEKYFSNVFKRIKGKSPSEYRHPQTQQMIGETQNEKPV